MEVGLIANPMYVVPIIVVIVCAFAVYAFGFKSAVPPPSFNQLVEEKKRNKKKTKENPKSNKAQQNGKLSGSTANSKPTAVLAKKKEEKLTSLKGTDKPNTTKTIKENKVHVSKKTHDKKETAFLDDLNGEGWVQHVSKKVRKNRKKEEIDLPSSVSVKSVDALKLDSNTPTMGSPEIAVVQIEKPEIKSDAQVASDENKCSSVSSLKQEEKLHNVPNEPSMESKSKKKKKRGISSEKVEKEIEIGDSSFTGIDSTSAASAKNGTEAPNVKISNVVFDELAGMYPEIKEPKKKRKVRRDH